MTVNETEDKERLDSEHFSPYRADGKLVSSFLFLALPLGIGVEGHGRRVEKELEKSGRKES